MSGNVPVALIFARQLDDDLAGLAKGIEKLLLANSKAPGAAKAVGVVVYVSDDKNAKADLKKFAAKNKLKRLAMTLNLNGSKKYKLNKDARHTVLLYSKKRVEKNFAFSKAISADGVKQILAAAEKSFAGKLNL